MSVKQKSQSRFNLSRKSSISQKKTYHQLIKEIPLKEYISDGFIYSFDYAEKLIEFLKFTHPEDLKMKLFSEKDNLHDLIKTLENLVIKPMNDSGYISEIHYNEKGHVSLLIPSIFISDINIFYISQINDLIEEFRTPFCILLKLIDSLSEVPFISKQDCFEKKNFFNYSIQEYHESIAFEENENDGFINQFNSLDYNDIEKLFFKYYNSDLSSFYSYKPKNKKERELKSLFKKIINISDEKDFLFDIMTTEDSMNDGESSFENMYLLFPKDDFLSNYELELMDSYFQNGFQPISVFLKFKDGKIDTCNYESIIKKYYDFYNTLSKINYLI